MATGIYLGAGGTLRKVKKIYFGIDGAPRKVKKVYIGTDGKVKLVYSEGVSKLLSTILNKQRTAHASASVGDYAFIGGGANPAGNDTSVDIFSNTLVHSSLTFSQYQNYTTGIKATSIGDYVLFGGGAETPYSDSAKSFYVTSFSSSLVMALCVAFPSKKTGHGAASNSNYAFFAFGDAKNTDSEYVHAYSASLVRKDIHADGVRVWLNGGRIGDYALFGPGYWYGNNTGRYVNAFTSSLTQIIVTNQAIDKYNYSVARAGENLIFLGGQPGYNSYDYDACSREVYAYNSSLVKIPMATFPEQMVSSSGTSLGDYAIFAGGGRNWIGGYVAYSKAYTYDKNLVLTQIDDLSVARSHLEAVSLGNRAIFSGGQNNILGDMVPSQNYALNTVDVYEI